MQADGDALAVDLFARHALDVDDVLEAVDGRDLALAVLVAAADDLDLVVLADGDAADLETRSSAGAGDKKRGDPAGGYGKREAHIVLFPQLLAQRRAHDVAADAGGGAIVGFPRLSPGRVEDCNDGAVSGNCPILPKDEFKGEFGLLTLANLRHCGRCGLQRQQRWLAMSFGRR